MNEMVTLMLTKPLHIESFLDPEAPLSQQFMEGLFAPVAPWLQGSVCVETWKDLTFVNPMTIVNMYSRETSLSFVTN